jgi:hypothetical protein
MGSSGARSASGLRGIAWLLVEANGARLAGGILEPGGQRVDALGGRAVALLGAWLGWPVAAGAAKASTDPALNNSAKDVV